MSTSHTHNQTVEKSNDVASGVENKLDEMLDTLDGLLSKLERNPRSTDIDSPTNSEATVESQECKFYQVIYQITVHRYRYQSDHINQGV